MDAKDRKYLVGANLDRGCRGPLMWDALKTQRCHTGTGTVNLSCSCSKGSAELCTLMMDGQWRGMEGTGGGVVG